jgi:predicted membrane protein DUF2142
MPKPDPYPPTPRGGTLLPSLVLCSYVLLTAAWIVGNPPPAAPDEWSHYIRIVSLGHGQLRGKPAGIEGAKSIVGPVLAAQLPAAQYQNMLAWLAPNTALVRIPGGLTPGWGHCGQGDPAVSAGCLNDAPPLAEAHDWFSPMSTYQPFPYLLPAAISRLDASPDALSRLMRVAKGTLSLALLGAAMLVTWSNEARLVTLLGLLVAFTPMAVFLSATLNPSGLEIAAATSFAATLLRITRGPDLPRKSAWLLLGCSGAILALSRTQGPVWIAGMFVLIVLMEGRNGFARQALAQRAWAWPAISAIVAAILLNRVWEFLYGPPLAFDPFPLRTSLSQGFAQLPFVIREQIGVFDYLEFGLPILAYGIWGLLTVGLVTTALLIGTRRERLILLTASAAAMALPVLLVATTLRHTGFSLQGRHVLGFAVLVPLLAGEILVRRYDRLRALDAEHVFVLFAAGIGFVQFVAWWTNARRFAVGIHGPRWFVSSAEWSPPFGWWPWIVCAAAAAAILFLVPVIDRLLTASRPSLETSERPAGSW